MNEHVVHFKKTDSKKQIAMGEIYVPDIPDSQGDYMTADEIERVAHDFMKNCFNKNIDTEHDLERNGSIVVETFIARDGDPVFTPGSWVAAVHIPDAEVWAKVESGEINGFSMYGTGVRKAVELEIEIPDDGIIDGETALGGLEPHCHQFTVIVDADGKFCGGKTDVVEGHSHDIVRGTATEPSSVINKTARTVDSHNHRFSFVEALIKADKKMKKKPDPAC